VRARLFFVLIFTILLSTVAPINTAAQPQISGVEVDYVFGEQMVFQITVKSDGPLQGALIFYRNPGDNQSLFGEMEVINARRGYYTLEFVHDLADQPLAPFTQLEYWAEVSFGNGEKISSPEQMILYFDNQREWQSLEDDPLRVYWYSGDLAHALEVMDVARGGLDSLQKVIPLTAPERVEIYVYPDIDTLASVFNAGSSGAVAGHSQPNAGVIVVALPATPEAGMLIEQRIPHELMHVLLYYTMGPAYDSLPVWLSEGLASVVELYPNSDYEVLLNRANEDENLLPMDSLCRDFPQETSAALLAYAQSTSFIRYLYQRFGSSGIQSLVDNYADGKSCQHGAEAAVGQNLTELEQEWRRETFGEDTSKDALNNLLPWLLLVGVLLAIPLLLTIVMVRKKR